MVVQSKVIVTVILKLNQFLKYAIHTIVYIFDTRRKRRKNSGEMLIFLPIE